MLVMVFLVEYQATLQVYDAIKYRKRFKMSLTTEQKQKVVINDGISIFVLNCQLCNFVTEPFRFAIIIFEEDFSEH